MPVVSRIGFAALVLALAAVRGSPVEAASGSTSPAGKRQPASRAFFSPTGVDIVFTSDRSKNADIWLLAADAMEPVNLTRHPFNDTRPEWSPDGRRIVFVSDRGGNGDVFVMNADGTALAQLTTDKDHDFAPTWSPDGKTIAFLSWRAEAGDTARANHVYMMNADGASQRRVIAAQLGVPFEVVDADPGLSFSPDGTRLVFTRFSGGEEGCAIVVAGVDGGEERVVVNESGRSETGVALLGPVDLAPRFSPDGQWIAFACDDRAGTATIQVVKADGAQRRVVVPKGQNYDPRWSPDGKWLIYSAGKYPERDVRAVEVQSGEVVPLITGKSVDQHGGWRP